MSIPILVIPLILILALCIIFSIEDISIWIICLIFICRILKRCSKEDYSYKEKIKFAFINTLLGVILVIMLNIAFKYGTKLFL